MSFRYAIGTGFRGQLGRWLNRARPSMGLWLAMVQVKSRIPIKGKERQTGRAVGPARWMTAECRQEKGREGSCVKERGTALSTGTLVSQASGGKGDPVSGGKKREGKALLQSA